MVRAVMLKGSPAPPLTCPLQFSLLIPLMVCQHCCKAVEETIVGVVGVTDVHIDLAAKSADIKVERRPPPPAWVAWGSMLRRCY